MDILIQQLQTVSDAQVAFHAGKNLLGGVLQRSHGKIGLTNFLPFKYTGNGFYGLFLEIQIRIKLDFHAAPPFLTTEHTEDTEKEFNHERHEIHENGLFMVASFFF
jgi:hypothetical protein